MLFSDLLGSLAQQPFGGLPGPQLGFLAKAGSNVSTPSPLPALNLASRPAEMMNAASTASAVQSENQLRAMQARQAQAELAMLRYRLSMAPDFMAKMNTFFVGGKGAQGADTGAAAPATSDNIASPAGNETGVSTDSPSGGNWEVAHNNFAGMRIPGTHAGPHEGGFQSFATPADGIGAISRQLDRYASGATTGKPINTLAGIVSTWAPPSENPTDALLQRAVNVTGFQPDQPLNLADPQVKGKVIEALIRNEQGGKLPVSAELINRVVSDPNASALTVGGALPAATPQNVFDAPASVAAPAPVTPRDVANARFKAQVGMPMSPQESAIAQLDPMKLAALQMEGKFIFGSDLLAPLAQAYYNSPQFKAQQAGAVAQAQVGPHLQEKWMAPEASVSLQGALEAAKARAKMLNTPINIRQGGSAWLANPDGTVRLLAQSPKLPEGYQLGPNGEAQEVPGAIPGIAKAATAQAAGPATFHPQEFFGPYGQAFQGTRAQLPQGGAQPINPVIAPGTGNLAVGGAINLAPRSPERPEAAGPTFPVQTPTGAKDISQVTVGDMFPNGQGIPQPPAPPPGMGYGKPDTATEKMQEDDATRLEGYNKEASENQKIYQDLAHLHDVLGQSLNTNKLAPLWTDLTNVAHGLGADNLIPKSYDPSNAAEFDKATTDLVFAAVKKLAGQVRVAEIEGYKRANPSLVIPRETNYNIVNDVLATAKWQDARARLANAYWTETGHAPLGAFDARFNQMAPLVDVTAAYKQAIRSIDPNARFPGEGTNAAATGTTLPPGIPAGSRMIGTMGGKPVYQAPNGTHYQVQ